MRRIVFFLVALGLLGSCSKPKNPGSPWPNIPPDTRLANVPPNDPEGRYPLFAIVTLYWVGSDPDGYVVAYRYRWSYQEEGQTKFHEWTTIPAIDSAGNPVEGATMGTFIFESYDSLNPHIFQVKAVDNEGAEDPTPAEVMFWTKRALPPETEIKSGPDSLREVFIIDEVTDTWEGITFTFSGMDDDGDVVDYAWRVDDNPWSEWQLATSATVLAKHLGQPLTGVHTFYVKARDDTKIEDPTPAHWRFRVVVPTWERPLLVLDHTRDGTGMPGSPTDAQVDDFYQRLLTGSGRTDFDTWDVKQKGFPDRRDLGKYRLIIWYDDLFIVDVTSRMQSADWEALQDYLNVGGKLIVSGWRFANVFPSYTDADTFLYHYVHTQLGGAEITQKDFIGARGDAGYPNLAIDPSKLPASWNGAIDRIALLEPWSFGETIYYFDSRSDLPDFEGKPVGLRYLGTTYSVIYFGFPLYFMEEAAATQALDKALKDLGE